MERENSQNKKFAQQNDPLDSAVKMLHGAERKKTQHKEAPQKIKGDQELVPQSHCHSEVSGWDKCDTEKVCKEKSEDKTSHEDQPSTPPRVLKQCPRNPRHAQLHEPGQQVLGLMSHEF